MDATTAPDYITRDAYEGRHSIHRRDTAVRAGRFLASEIAAMAPEGIIWASFGHAFPGREGFGRNRYVADAAGNLHLYDSDGRKVIIHPAGRAIRVLTR